MTALWIPVSPVAARLGITEVDARQEMRARGMQVRITDHNRVEVLVHPSREAMGSTAGTAPPDRVDQALRAVWDEARWEHEREAIAARSGEAACARVLSELRKKRRTHSRLAVAFLAACALATWWVTGVITELETRWAVRRDEAAQLKGELAAAADELQEATERLAVNQTHKAHTSETIGRLTDRLDRARSRLEREELKTADLTRQIRSLTSRMTRSPDSTGTPQAGRQARAPTSPWPPPPGTDADLLLRSRPYRTAAAAD